MADQLPKIGKNVLETLTSGMYEDPLFIYREYIQNSADQIDVAIEEEILENRNSGKISITIDTISRSITIEDNATGIKSSNTRRFLSDVANSEKDMSTRKGFRGIGRLGGLGYCQKLVFETSYKGEGVRSLMTLNSKLLKTIIENRQDTTDAAGAISIITKVENSKAAANDHYFKVTLLEVTNDKVLDIKAVEKYLSMVAPLPFNDKFRFKNRIRKYFSSKNIIFDEYNVTLNSTPLYKAYKNYLNNSDGVQHSEITSVDFFDVRDNESQLLAIGWYGISSRLNEVIDKINIERGIRIRKNNISIGSEQTLFPRFRAERTNLRYIGEIHVIGEGFIPNARRDYFNDNKTLELFENSLDVIFKDFENKLPHKASDLHNRLKNIIQFKELVQSYRVDVAKFKTATERDQRLSIVLDSLENAKRAEKKLNNIKIEANTNDQLNELFKRIVGDYDYSIKEQELSELHFQKVYPPLEFSKVNTDQKKILNEVVIFLQTELGHQQADRLIAKLQKKYHK